MDDKRQSAGPEWVFLTALMAPHALNASRPLARKIAQGMVDLGSLMLEAMDEQAETVAPATASVKPSPTPAAAPRRESMVMSADDVEITAPKPKVPNVEEIGWLSESKVADAAKTAAEAPKPPAEAVKPVIEAPKPAPEAVKPVIEAPKPAAEAPKPVIEAPKPPTEAVKPVVDAPKTIQPLSAASSAAEIAGVADLLAGLEPPKKSEPEPSAADLLAQLEDVKPSNPTVAEAPKVAQSEPAKPIIEAPASAAPVTALPTIAAPGRSLADAILGQSAPSTQPADVAHMVAPAKPAADLSSTPSISQPPEASTPEVRADATVDKPVDDLVKPATPNINLGAMASGTPTPPPIPIAEPPKPVAPSVNLDEVENRPVAQAPVPSAPAPSIPAPVAAQAPAQPPVVTKTEDEQWLKDLANQVGEGKPELEDVGEWDWAKQRQAQRAAGGVATPSDANPLNAVESEEGRRSIPFPGLAAQETQGRSLGGPRRPKFEIKLRRPPVKPKMGVRAPIATPAPVAPAESPAPVSVAPTEIPVAVTPEPVLTAAPVDRKRFVVPDDLETA
jgi:hypothetical protein